MDSQGGTEHDGLESRNSATYRHKPTNSRYGPYLYSRREQQNNINQYQYTGESNYSNNSERDSLNLRNYGYALNRSNITYEKDRQDNNYGTQTIQGKGNSNCSRNATITSQNYNFATNNPVEPSNVQHENETHSRWENSVYIPNSNISNSNTCTTPSNSGLLQSYSFSFNQQMCPSVQNSLDWKSTLRINESVGMQGNKGSIESAPPYSGAQANSSLFQSYPFPCNQQVCPSVPNLLDCQSIAGINENTNVGMQGNKGNIESVPSYSGSSQLSSCTEPDGDSAEGSVSDLQSMVSSDEDTDEEMEQNEGNTGSAQNSADSKPRSKKTIRKARWKQRKRQRKQERRQARQSRNRAINPPSDPNCIALRPDQTLKLLTPDGTEFLKILGEATNLKIAMNKYFNDSYTCTLEGPEEFKCKAKKAIERYCNPFQAAKPNCIYKLNVDCDVTSVRQTFRKLNDQRINWKMAAENLYENLENTGEQIAIRIARLQENTFPSPRKYHDCKRTLRKLIKTVKFRYKVVNAIILVILKVADAPVHIQILKQWVEDGKETENNSIENAFNYIFRNETHLDIDYKQVMQRLPQGVNCISLIEKVGHLMTSGVAICEKFQWEDRLKLLKCLYADIIINNYSDKSINILNMNVINLQLKSTQNSSHPHLIKLSPP